MWIACYLLKTGLVSVDEFADAIQRQSETRPPLGRLALEARKLTARQVKEVLLAQAKNPTKPFGKLAREMEFLTEEELAVLLVRQQDLTQPLPEILVELGAIDRTQLQQELQRARITQCDGSDLEVRAAVGRT